VLPQLAASASAAKDAPVRRIVAVAFFLIIIPLPLAGRRHPQRSSPSDVVVEEGRHSPRLPGAAVDWSTLHDPRAFASPHLRGLCDRLSGILIDTGSIMVTATSLSGNRK
jgi:hypothetical protein